MARLTEEDRELILADFHTGHFTQRELSKKYEVSTATINKLTKGIEPKHTDKVNAIVKATRELSVESEQEVNAVHKVVDEKVRREGLVFTASEKILQLSTKMAEANKKEVVVKVKKYSKENGSSESLDKINVGLDTSDLKNLADAIDKSAITLKVADRHAPRIDITQNQLQTTPAVTIEIVEDRQQA